MKWHTAVERILPHVVRITTPTGSGTGFLRTRKVADGVDTISFATAAHVIDQAHQWEQPIRIHHQGFPNGVLVIHPNERGVYIHSQRLDVAALVVIGLPSSYAEAIPEEPIKIVPRPRLVKRGVEIGWLGYPSLVEDGTHCCFFSGMVSHQQPDRYFVDGVAIHGVSGGPAFVISGEGPVIMGCISRYIPNVVGSDRTALPGLLVVENVADLSTEDQGGE